MGIYHTLKAQYIRYRALKSMKVTSLNNKVKQLIITYGVLSTSRLRAIKSFRFKPIETARAPAT